MTVEYRTERSEGGYAAKALAQRESDRTMPKASRQNNRATARKKQGARSAPLPLATSGYVLARILLAGDVRAIVCGLNSDAG